MEKLNCDSEIKAVHDDDLDNLLQSLGILERINSGKIKCKFCGGVVTKESLHSLFPQSGDVKVVCKSPSCMKSLRDYLRS